MDTSSIWQERSRSQRARRAGWLDGATAWACPLSEIESCFGCGSVLRCDEKPEHAEVWSFSIVDG
jgi:hypothetical protein